MKKEDEAKLHLSLQKKKPKKNAICYKLETMQDIYNAVTVDNVEKFLQEMGIIIRSNAIAKRLNGDKPMEVLYTNWIDD